MKGNAVATARPVAPLHVEPRGTGVYEVTGGVAPHVVAIGPASATCDCPDYAYRRHGCKHLRAAIDFLVLAPFAVTSAAGPGLTDVAVPPPQEPT